ncbi:ATP-dependent DNA helicase RecQ-like [Haliotis rufescens]|uniref:ATP-dependent DNA helicase RecQ-like n=1 Tax=Haliotis rufescens TaxID=6454 RepID=UPI00201F60E8|nr:ATP-dependent DNA helicase RecQ-like [Haliotis rufescens]
MAAEFETALAYAKDNIDISFKLKDKQEETLKTVFAGRDCIAVLPTGYGKSLIFQLLPFLLQRDRPAPGIVIVVSPLNSLMQDQVISLCEKGVKACFLNCQVHRSDAVRTYKRTSDEQKRTLSDIIAKKRKQDVSSEPTPIVTETSKPETSPEKDEMDIGRRFVLNFTFH